MAEATETALACIREEVERAFSSAPGAVLEAALSRIAPADECARAAAYAAWDSIAHPLGGLGDFEDAVACIAAAQGSAEVAEFPRALAVFFSDNGVVAEGVSQSGQDVTRAVALAKLRLTATDTVWDVGAGTGSVSIEAALVARAGSVWAVERNAAGVRLIRENADAFGCGNVHAVPGVAPEALAKLPVPDAVFVGGSAGELPSIVEAALEKNSQVRLCVPCVTVETLTEACALLSGSRFKGFEACQVSAARAEAVGSHHLMKAQNPVFLVSARGAGGEGGAR